MKTSIRQVVVENYKKSHPLEKIKKNISEFNNYISFKDKLTKNKFTNFM